jgi:hypothetical protein
MAQAGTSGTDGTSGVSPSVSGSDNQVLTSDGLGGITSETNLTFDGTELIATGYQRIIDTVGGAPGSLRVDSSVTNTTHNAIFVTNTGDFTNTNSLVGVNVDVTDGIFSNTCFVGLTFSSYGSNYGIDLRNGSTETGSSQYGASVSVNGSGPTEKYGYFAYVTNTSDYNYGVYVNVGDATVGNYGIYSRISSSTGDTYGLYILNSGTDSGGSDLHYGGKIIVNGEGQPTSTVKYGLEIDVSDDAEINYGVHIDVAGATDNYSIVTQNGVAVFNNSSTTTSDFQIKGSSDSNLFFVDASSDNVGIGTNSPTRKFHVNGDYTFVHNPTTELTTSVEGYGDIVTFGGGSLTAGDLYYLDSLGSWSVADANSTSSSTGMLAFALGTSASDGMLVRGYIRNSGFTTNTGNIVYVSTTAGEVTTTAPSSSGDVIRIIGYSIDGTNEIIYFSPDNSWVEI